MAKQNVVIPVSSQLRAREDATTNFEGGLAFEMPAMEKLMTRIFSSLMGEPKFYETAEAGDNGLFADVHMAANENPEMVLRLAAYGRQVMNMRSTPIAVLTEAAAIPACKPFVRRWTPQIVRRADEPAEVIALWVKRHGAIGSQGKSGGEHAFPNALTRGLEDALRRFDEYQFAKYDRDGSVKLRDVLRIVRPKPQNEAQAALYRYIVKGEVDANHLPLLTAKAALLRREKLDEEALGLARAAHATWEVLSSKFGRSAETWNALAETLPFMAGMRNLSNIMSTGANKALDRVVAMLQDARQVQRSKQLPFRFLSAHRAVESGLRFDRKNNCQVVDEGMRNHPRRREVLDAILTALELSAANLPRLPGRTFVTTDNSGSMGSSVSAHSTITCQEVGNLLGAITHAMCENAIVSVFGETHAVVDLSRKDSILTNMKRLNTKDVGHSTEAWLAIRHLRDHKISVDRIVLFSDMQCYSSAGWGGESLAEELRKYRSAVNPNVHLHSVDLAGYGTLQFPADEKRVSLIAGWSEKVLEFLPAFEGGMRKALERIVAWTPRDHEQQDSSPDENGESETD